MTKIIHLLCLLSISFSYAQTKRLTPTLELGYAYSQASYLLLGAGLLIKQPNDHSIHISTRALLGYRSNKLAIIPEVGVGYFWDFSSTNNSTFLGNGLPLLQFSNRAYLSPWTINPEVGLVIFRYLEYSFGYSFQFKDHPEINSLQGFKMTAGFHIPF